MKAINFRMFPLTMGLKYARRVLRQFDGQAKLPRRGRILYVSVPLSGTLTFTRHEHVSGNPKDDIFSITAEPMDLSGFTGEVTP